MEESVQPASRGELPRREVMQAPEEVAAMMRLKALGWGVRRIASELGCSHMTVRRELEREKGIRLTLPTVEREVSHLRRELEAEASDDPL